MSVAMVRSSGYNRIHSALTSESFAALYYPIAYERYQESDAECLDLTHTVDLEARIHRFFFPDNTPAPKSGERNEIPHRLQPLPSPLDSSTVEVGMRTKFGVFPLVPQPPSSNDDFLSPDSSKPLATLIVPPPSDESEEDEEARWLAPSVMAPESMIEAPRLESRLEGQRARRERVPVSRRDISGRTVNQMGPPPMRRSDTLGLYYSNYSTSSSRSIPPIATPKRTSRMGESSVKRELLPL